MTSEQISKIVSEHFKCDITQSRENRFIYMRAICNNLCRIYTNESLQTIGKYYDGDHATVLHSIKKFHSTYIDKTDPFNVIKEFNFLAEYIEKLEVVGEIVKQDYNYIELSNKYYELLKERNILEAINNDQYKVIKELEKKLVAQDNFNIILKQLHEFSDKDVEEFLETRLEPFKKMIMCRKQRLNKVS